MSNINDIAKQALDAANQIDKRQNNAGQSLAEPERVFWRRMVKAVGSRQAKKLVKEARKMQKEQA